MSTHAEPTTRAIRVEIDGIGLHVQLTGRGDPLILVHGSWGDADSWAPVVGPLAAHHQVVTYDRRGHTRSDRGARPPRRADHARDLAALIEHLGPPAHLVGNSSGASIVLTLAASRPDLAHSVLAHEPAVLSLVADGPDPQAAAAVREARAGEARVAELVRGGDVEAGTRFFIDELAVGPGTWDALPAQRREAFMANAPTFLDDHDDPTHETIELDALAASPVPVLVTRGTDSPPMLMAAASALADALPAARSVVLDGAGHIPHLTHPDLFVDTLRHFHAQVAASGSPAS